MIIDLTQTIGETSAHDKKATMNQERSHDH